MVYRSYTLNGAWEMYYQENLYIGTDQPLRAVQGAADAAGTEPQDQSSHVIEKAVPGYWEDMTEDFQETPFFRNLRVNPEYGLQRYPMAGSAPDMALPNVMGNFFYRRSFVLPESWEIQDAGTELCFEGVQNAVSVWINDVYLGRHEGYSVPFEMKIPAGILKNGENQIVLSVSNHRLSGYAGEPIIGLTSRAANEYTGGITGDVELRQYVGGLREVSVRVSEDCRQVTASLELDPADRGELRWEVRDGERVVKQGTIPAKKEITFDAAGLELWSPEHPKLYSLVITWGECVLVHPFGVRRLTADGEMLRLNGEPCYLRGICEHGYFPETVHPNHDAAYYRKIIRVIKKLGFNFIRFHTFVPEREYLQAADELGVLVQVECPNNTTPAQWKEIVNFCRKYTSSVIYCCGNELLMDEPFIEYLQQCGKVVHEETDALFAPMSAMRGLEYFWVEPEQEAETRSTPFKHHPRRIATVGEFSDVYCSYPNGQHSYFYLDGDPRQVDEWGAVYGKPRLSHEIGIDGTYMDLSLKNRYLGTRIGKTELFTSVEEHLEKKGVLHKAPLYFKNSSEWQRRLRKFCFEQVRRSERIAGYDFLGPIDTHWHTFGYDVGMMNEFYELKPGETVRNVRMYNSPTVILTDLGRKTNRASGERLSCGIFVSHFGKADLKETRLAVRLETEEEVFFYRSETVSGPENGHVSEVYRLEQTLPQVEKPMALRLYVTLDGDGVFAENEWELYVFPVAGDVVDGAAMADQMDVMDIPETKLVVSDGMSPEELESLLNAGKDVLLLGTEPFASLPASFQIALAGRTSGNLATVIADHPLFHDLPHEGFCGWQFGELLEGSRAVCFESDQVPFEPIIEVVSTHKYVIRQAALFEFRVGNGRLLVCGLNLKDTDPAARWLKDRLLAYVRSEDFRPKHVLDEQQLRALVYGKVRHTAVNTNLAFNVNDKTAVRGKRGQ